MADAGRCQIALEEVWQTAFRVRGRARIKALPVVLQAGFLGWLAQTGLEGHAA